MQDYENDQFIARKQGNSIEIQKRNMNEFIYINNLDDLADLLSLLEHIRISEVSLR